jgi:hypothetical protein
VVADPNDGDLAANPSMKTNAPSANFSRLCIFKVQSTAEVMNRTSSIARALAYADVCMKHLPKAKIKT